MRSKHTFIIDFIKDENYRKFLLSPSQTISCFKKKKILLKYRSLYNINKILNATFLITFLIISFLSYTINKKKIEKKL